MQLGFVSAILPDLSLEEVFATARETGYTAVELMCWPPGKADRRYAGVTHIDVTHVDEAEAARIHALAQAYGLTISALGYYPNPLTPDEEASAAACAHLRLVILAAKQLGVSVVTTFVGRDWTRSVEANWPRFVSVWTELIAFAEEHGRRIAIENCPMLFSADEWPGGKNLASSPAIWRRMFEAIPSAYFGLNYDPSHLLWQQMDYLTPLKEFASRIFHVHLKDATVDKENLNQVGVLAFPNLFHTPKLPGRGHVDWEAFLRAVQAAGYDGPVCVEVEERAFEGTLALRKQALQLSASYVQPILQFNK
jgi:sugar phosphate isomerase/epimerase